MIQTKDLSYKIGNKVLIDKLSLSFSEHQLTLIVGANGAGKSTFIQLLSQELNPSSGSILFNDRNITAISKAEMAQQRAVLSQDIELSFPLSVQEIVMMGRYPHFKNSARNQDIKICEEAMKFFDVYPMMDRNYMTLSGGEKQRVQFARVAAQIWPDDSNKTKYLFLDEPLTYLDIYFQYQFMDQLKELMQLQPMLILGVVHDINLAYQYADNVVMLSSGKLIAAGDTKTVFSSENLIQTFKMKPKFFKDEQLKEYICF